MDFAGRRGKGSEERTKDELNEAGDCEMLVLLTSSSPRSLLESDATDEENVNGVKDGVIGSEAVAEESL